MNLDFRNCKTAEDVKKVFAKNKKGFAVIKKINQNIRRNSKGKQKTI